MVSFLNPKDFGIEVDYDSSIVGEAKKWEEARAKAIISFMKEMQTPRGQWEAARKRFSNSISKENEPGTPEYVSKMSEWEKENPSPKIEPVKLDASKLDMGDFLP